MKFPLLAWQEFSGLQRTAVLLLLLAGLVEIISGIALPFAGYDTYNHIYWIGEWHKLWVAGIFYPRWLPDSFSGFGAPTFYFYPPFTYVLSSALYAIMPGMTPESIGKILALLTLIASGISMSLYLRWKWPNRWANIFGALLYMFAPYRFFDYSTRGALSEHVSLIFVPLLFWGIDSIIERRGPRHSSRGFMLLVGGISFLILTNLPTAVVATVGVAIYALAQEKQSRTQALKWGATATVLAGLLCAFYLLPAYAFHSVTQMGRLWMPVPMAWGSPLTAIFTGENITINVYTLLMFIGAAVLLVAILRNHERNGGLVAILLTVFILELPIVSYYLFEFVPPFTVAQLPYRFSILVLIVVAIVWQNELRNRTGNASSMVIAAWSLAVVVLIVVSFAKFHIHPDDRLPIGDAQEYASRWEQPPPFQKHGQQAYLDFAASLAAPFANERTWAVWQSSSLPSSMQYKRMRDPYSDTIEYNVPQPGSILLRRSYWPTWKASIDGKYTTMAPDSLGRLTIPVPNGQHRLIVRLGTSIVEKVGTWISLLTLLLLTGSWIYTRKRNQYPKRSSRVTPTQSV